MSTPLLVDARGLACPWPALRLARALRAGNASEIEVLADDPRAETELAAVADAAGWTISGANGRFRAVPLTPS